MTAELDISHREDKKGIELILTQLTDPNGNTALVADIVAGNLAGGTAANLSLSGNLSVTGTTSQTGNLTTGNVAATGLVAVTGNATVSGNFTVSGTEMVSGGNLAAAGSVQGNAAAVVTDNVWVTAANATKGVVLPTSVAGMRIAVKNDDTANAILKVYPAGSEMINAITGGSPISMAAKTSAIFCCSTAGFWFTVPLLPS